MRMLRPSILSLSLLVAMGAVSPSAWSQNTTDTSAADATTPTQDAAQIAAAAAKNRGTYNPSTQTLEMPGGATMKMSEMSPEYRASQVNALGGINRYNINQASQQGQMQQQSANGISGQAYRTGLSGMASTQKYVTDPGQVLIINGERRDPRDLPGMASLTPSVYFVSPTRDVVVVSVTLTGGVGPAIVGYRTLQSDLPRGAYTPVSGTLAWHSGELGTKSFVIPVSNSFIAQNRIAGGSIDFGLTGAQGAQLAASTGGRVIIGSGIFTGYAVPGCGTEGGLPCQNPGPLPSGKPVPPPPAPPKHHPSSDDGCVKQGHPGYAGVDSGTVPIECR